MFMMHSSHVALRIDLGGKPVQPRLLTAGLRVLVSSPFQHLNAKNRHAIVECIGEARYVIAILSQAALSNQ